MTERIIACDMKLDEWTVGEADAYRKAVGVNAEYAYGALMEALRTTRDEARDTFGDAVDAEDWTPPDDWLPMAMLNVPPQASKYSTISHCCTTISWTRRHCAAVKKPFTRNGISTLPFSRAIPCLRWPTVR